MITVKQAEKFVLKNVSSLPMVRRPLTDACGCVLRENILADRDQPPFNRVMMDGIAICRKYLSKGKTAGFPIEGIARAGAKQKTLRDQSACWEVMTGAILPKGCDCVIPYEDVEIRSTTARISLRGRLKRMQNVHSQGCDHKKGKVVLKRGSILGPAQISIAAAVGQSLVRVSRQPKICIISTGDELVGVGQKVAVHTIRSSNDHAVESALRLQGFSNIKRSRHTDDPRKIQESIKKNLAKSDVLIVIGGVSMGKFDFVPNILKDLRVKKVFHKVKEKPGKPLWFGKHGRKTVFGLPGNPVSAFVCTYRYAIPYLLSASGIAQIRKEKVVLARNFRPDTQRAYFLPVRVRSASDGRLVAMPVPTSCSGDPFSLSQTDGFIELKENTREFRAGYVAPFFRWQIIRP